MTRIAVLILFILSTVSFTFGQTDTISSVELGDVKITAKKSPFKKIGLYDEDDEDEEFDIRGFSQLVIFENSLTDEFWATENSTCVTGKLDEDEGGKFMRLEWNQSHSDCDWVGFGFGWDSWAGKDMGYVADTMAIELIVRSTDKAFTNIPWAFCIEDYGGQQGWLGYNKSFLKADEISTEWTKVEIPLPLFPFQEFDVDLTNVKQMLVQVFATGVIEIKSIKLIPFSGKLRKEVIAESSGPVTVDGNLDEWSGEFNEVGNGHSFAVKYSDKSIYLAFKVKDDTPLENVQNKGDLWNGDAIEIAYATNPKADPKRKFYLFSDQHVGLNCGNDPYLWDWVGDKVDDKSTYKINRTDSGYEVEMELPVFDLHNIKLYNGMELGFEIAIDLNAGKARKAQERWNSELAEGFHESPERWGVLVLQ